MADAQKVIDLNVVGGSGYTNGTYTWTSSGGGCSPNASGTIAVTGGVIGNSNYTISNMGAGCTSRPSISIPAGAGSGTGGSITATVYQTTPHNASPKTWSVPGVDYKVGYDTTLTLADPTGGGLPSGCALAGHTVTCAGGGGTLNGWNFGTHSNNLVINAAGWTVSNNLFVCTHGTTTDLDQIHINSGVGGTTTIKNNTFNGGSALGVGCVSGGMTANIQTVQTGGTLIIEYNYCFLPDSKCVNIGSSGTSASMTVTEKYNYWGELGLCGSPPCSHGEAEYSFGSTTQTVNWTLQFNVGINHFYSSPTNLTSELAQVGDQMIVATDTEYNYILARGNQLYTGSNNNNGQVASASLFCGHQEGGSASGTIANNLFDYSGAFFPYNGSGSTCAGDFTFSGNLNAGTGNSCTTATCN